MPAVLRHPVARFIAATALVGSLADWVLFATLVVTVDAWIGGGPWATALVLLVRILPSVAFAPLAARRVDRRPLRATLVGHEALRATAIVGLAGAFALRSLPAVLVALLVLEFAAAMLAAARESTISRHVPAGLFTSVNTITAVLAYGLLPIGPVIVAATSASAGWVVVVSGSVTLAVAYRVLLPLGAAADATMMSEVADPGHHVEQEADTAAASPVSWRRVTVAAALGVLPAVALFALGPTIAGTWLGDRAATGPLYAVVLGGGAVGFAIANLARGFRADLAMLAAAGGLVMAATGLWIPGMALLGVGAGAAYLDLQTRLQHAATDPSQFATAFAVLKVASAAGVVAAPALAQVAPIPVVLLALATAATAGAVVAAPSPSALVRTALRTLLRVIHHGVVKVEVINRGTRLDRPAVVVSNHPHWLDGVVALSTDRTLRPIARWQPHRGARLGIWAADAVVTHTPADGTRRGAAPVPGDHRPAFAQAADHLVDGGRIWLAPEGGSHQDPALRAPRSGAVRMAHLAGVPIQPLAIEWADGLAGPDLSRWRPWRRVLVRVRWGTPVATTGDVERDNTVMMTALSAATGMPVAAAPEPEPVPAPEPEPVAA